MGDLVKFLIEEGFCYKESEALRILESVSDTFYDYLVESYQGNYDISRRAPERLAMMRDKLKTLTAAVQRNPTTASRNQIERIQRLRAAIPGQQGLSRQEMEFRKATGRASRGLQATPRGPSGSRFQKPRDVIAPGTISDIAKTSVSPEREATRMTGISPGSKGTRSIDSGSTRTAEIVSDRYKSRGSSGGGGTFQARSGGTRGVRRP